MTVLPVVERELRVASRRRATYWTRCAAALVALAISFFIFLTGHNGPERQIAQVLFASISALAFVVCHFAGAGIADCVSEEKREGTLGLLFLTDLKGYDVLFGKLAAGSLNWIYATFAVFPVLALPLLLGGVAPGAFWRMIVLLLNTLFLSLSLGMASSTFSRESRRAIAVTLASMVFLTGGLPLLGAILEACAGPRNFPTQPHLAFLLPSPAFAFYEVTTAAFSASSAQYYGWSMLTLHGLGWLALASACFVLPRCWQDRPATPGTANWRQGWNRLKFGTAGEAKALRDRLLEINPVLWAGGRDRLKGWLVWAFLAVAGVVWLWGYQENKRNWLEPIVGVWVALVVHGVLKTWLASEACRLMIEHRRGGALELLLSTPLSTEQIIRGQRLALWRQFGGPVVTVLMADLFLLLGSLSGRFSVSGEEKEIIVTYFAGMLMLAMDYYVLGWVGIWCGLSARNFNRAAADVIGRILILPWGVFCLTMILYATLDWQQALSLDFQWGVAWWFFLSAGLNLLFLRNAQRRLGQSFRLVAAQQYAPASRRRWWFARRPADSNAPESSGSGEVAGT